LLYLCLVARKLSPLPLELLQAIVSSFTERLQLLLPAQFQRQQQLFHLMPRLRLGQFFQYVHLESRGAEGGQFFLQRGAGPSASVC